MARHGDAFDNVDTAADDTCLFAFTSGTTGQPKATMHFHRDVMAACACWPRHVLRPRPDDVFIGSPPLAFTFGLGGLLLFPMSVGASTVLLEKARAAGLARGHPGVRRHGAGHRADLVPRDGRAGARAAPVGAAGRNAAPVRLGRRGAARGDARAVEGRHRHRADRRHRRHRDAAHLHLRRRGARPPRRHRHGRARLPRLRGGRRRAARCRRARSASWPSRARPAAATSTMRARRSYVKDGWNFTGDAYLMDADGYFHYQARTDDMIISAGYNIGAPEVEEALLQHPAVAECAVIGVPDDERGQIVKAFVVLRAGVEASDDLARGAAGLRQADHRALQVPARDRVPQRAAAHRDRQAAALPIARRSLRHPCIFEREQLIRFSHCDPAAIVFFPQYFVMFNGLVEDWFDDGLGLGYASVVVAASHRLADGRAEVRIPDPEPHGRARAAAPRRVERLGRSSITLDTRMPPRRRGARAGCSRCSSRRHSTPATRSPSRRTSGRRSNASRRKETR